MATDIEKNDHVEELERVRTEDASSNNGDFLEPVQSHQTLGKVDIHNKQAFKGDESDGKFSWGPRKWIAALSLACLYTGASPVLGQAHSWSLVLRARC